MCYDIYFHPGFAADFEGFYGHLVRLGIALLGLYLMRSTHAWNRRAKFWALYLTFLAVVMVHYAPFLYVVTSPTIELWYVQILYFLVLVGFTSMAWVKKSVAAVRGGVAFVCLSNLLLVASFIPFSTYEVKEEMCGAVLETSAYDSHFAQLSEAISISAFFRPVVEKFSCACPGDDPLPQAYGRVYHGPYTITQASGEVLTGHFDMGVPSGELHACSRPLVEF